MKTLPFLLTLLLTGCASSLVVLDTTPRPATHQVAVFKDGSAPAQKYTVIAEMSWHGPRQDELIAEAHFMTKAAKLGAAAILFRVADVDSKFSSGSIGANGVSLSSSSSSNDWFFKAKAIVYDP